MAEEGFFEMVYAIVEKIPPGYVVTYGQIARAIGSPKSARIVGYAMKNAPNNRNLPCHRVVNRLGRLSPEYVFGSRDFQRIMLEDEGITFNNEGNINMGKHIWNEI